MNSIEFARDAGKLLRITEGRLNHGTARYMATAALLAFWLVFPTIGFCELSQAHVIDGGGGWSSNATFDTFAAVCQPCPVGVNSDASHLNRSGFLHVFTMHTNLDYDSDGIVDEDDPDDDGDGLDDADELSGDAFVPSTITDPMTADSDGDGMTDGDEAGAGSNPWDPNSLLRIIAVEGGDSHHVVTWQSRNGYAYDLNYAGRVADLATAATAATVTATGGVGPWGETHSVATNTSGSEATFYRVEVVDRP